MGQNNFPNLNIVLADKYINTALADKSNYNHSPYNLP
jgi:hypothetical protein